MSIRLFSHQSYIYITLFIILTIILFFFFLNYPATTEIYTLSLHDALPISAPGQRDSAGRPSLKARARSEPRTPSLPDRKSTRLNSSHVSISYAVFCLKKKKNKPSQYTIQKKTKNTNNKKHK